MSWSGHNQLPRVSVVMPTVGRAGMLPTVLGPLLADSATSELIVACDGSADDSVAVVDRLARADARLRALALPHGGPESARRAGVEAASGDIVLLVDDDVRAEAALVTGHAAAHRAGRSAASSPWVVQGYMPVALPTPRRPGQAATFLYAEEYEAHCQRLQLYPDRCLYELWGGNVSLPRDLALAVSTGSGFPATFYEDTHFGLLCHRHGARGRFDRSLRALHLHSRTTQQFVRNAFQQGAGKWWLHRWHPDLLGTFDPDQYLQGIPSPVRAIIRRLEGSDGAFLRRAGCVGAQTAGCLRQYRVETTIARGLRRIAQYLGATRAAGDAQLGSTG